MEISRRTMLSGLAAIVAVSFPVIPSKAGEPKFTKEIIIRNIPAGATVWCGGGTETYFVDKVDKEVISILVPKKDVYCIRVRKAGTMLPFEVYLDKKEHYTVTVVRQYDRVYSEYNRL